jgi:hypothetical protein
MLQMQGARVLANEAYFLYAAVQPKAIATPQMGYLPKKLIDSVANATDARREGFGK